jgi:hypothetical protein
MGFRWKEAFTPPPRLTCHIQSRLRHNTITLHKQVMQCPITQHVKQQP